MEGKMENTSRPKLSFVISREQLSNLYKVLVAGSEQPESREIVMFFSDPEVDSVNPDELSENQFLLTLDNFTVGRIVKYAQVPHFTGEMRTSAGGTDGQVLSDEVRKSLIKGRKKSK